MKNTVLIAVFAVLVGACQEAPKMTHTAEWFMRHEAEAREVQKACRDTKRETTGTECVMSWRGLHYLEMVKEGGIVLKPITDDESRLIPIVN